MKKRTVFIVGAGASTDFGLPLGSELVRNIRNELTSNLANPNHQGLVQQAMAAGIPGDYGAAARDVAGGMVSARSIDRFLDSRKDRPLTVHMGKCAIAYCLSSSESNSPLGSMRDEEWVSIQNALVSCEKSWLAITFALLHEGFRPADSEKIFENVSFITFNYDRCIQRYLHLAFRQIMGLSEEDAFGIVGGIPIVHVYGSLGPLPSPGKDGIPFGPSLDRARESALLLRTFTEGAAEGSMDEAHKLIDDAEQIVSLGFAFDPLNVNALFPVPLQKEPAIHATRLGVADPEIVNFGVAIGGKSVSWENSRCQDFCQTLTYRTICQA